MVKWKREKVQDHKFDFVDVHEFEKHDFVHKIKYSFVFFIVLKSVLVYMADIYNAGALLLTDKWAGGIKPKIPFVISKWIFVGSILISFLLLFIEVKKARLIVASRDISFAFTSIVAYRYYTLTSYPHWCFFQEINDTQRGLDKVAFFVFFAFKGWKRLIFCDGPRQVINAITLYTLFHDRRFTTDINKYGSMFTQASMGVMIFTVSIFVVSACMLLIAFIMYLPLLCQIQGNLKEYCCHIIDKRIAEILKKQRNKRLRKEASKPPNRNQLDGVSPTLPVLDRENDNIPYKKVPYTKTPPPVHPYHDPPPVMFNNYNGPPQNDPYMMGRPNIPRKQSPYYDPQPQGFYENGGPYMGRRDSDSSQPTYDQPIGMEFPPRSDTNNSNSAYSGLPYITPVSPSHPHQYPYQPQTSDQYGYVVDQNVPHPNQYYEENDYYNEPYSQPPQSPHSPQNTQFVPIGSARQQITNAIPPSLRNGSNALPARNQQNPSSRPYNNNYPIQGGRRV